MRETTSTTYELVDLVPYTEYSIRVQAVNENGPGAFSKDIVIRTHSAQPTQPPHNVTLEAASSTVNTFLNIFKIHIVKNRNRYMVREKGGMQRKFPYLKFVYVFSRVLL